MIKHLRSGSAHPVNLPVFVHSLSPHLSNIRLPGFFAPFLPATPATALPSKRAGPLAIRPKSDFLESIMEYEPSSSRTDLRASTGERQREYCSSPSSGGWGAPPLAFSSDDEPRRRTAARDAGGSLLRAEAARGGAKGRAGVASERSASESRAAIASKYRSADRATAETHSRRRTNDLLSNCERRCLDENKDSKSGVQVCLSG